MLSKRNKLNTKEFEYVFERGKNLRSKTFFVKFLGNDLNRIRVGVGVTKKLTKKAVERNRYKRILRHLLKESLIDVKAGYDVIVIVNENAKRQTFEELKMEVYELLRKTNIF